MNEVFSDATGAIQFVELLEANGTPNEVNLGGRSVTAMSIAGDEPEGCRGNGGAAGPTPRYNRIAERTGGPVGSICSVADSMSAVIDTVFGPRQDFPLSLPAVNGSIRVFIDGVEVAPTGPAGAVRWTYDLARQRLQFAASGRPEPGAEVVIEYEPACP